MQNLSYETERDSEGGRGVFSRLVGALLLLATALFLTACEESYPQSTISPHTDFAEIIHGLYVNIFWWTMFVLGVVWILLAWVVVRYREREGDEHPRQIRGHMGLEIGWTTGPALIVLAIAIPSIQAVFATQRPISDDALLVEVTGHQFWWEFHYPEEGVTTANELYLPADRSVSLRLGSADVIHSFWVPKLGGKRDVNPVVAVREPDGEPEYNWLYFTPFETGVFFGQCAEFCGDSHALMRMRVVVQEEDEFEDWIERWHVPSPTAAPPEAEGEAEEEDEVPETGPAADLDQEVDAGAAEAPAPDPEQVSLGRDIFLHQSTCVACHAIQGTTAQGRIGPDLTRFGERMTVGAGLLDNDRENLVRWISDPESIKPGVLMPGVDRPGGNWPPTNLTEEQVEAVAAYLLSLR